MCARPFRAAPATRSSRHLHRFIPSLVAVPARGCSRTSLWPSSTITCRSTDKPRSSHCVEVETSTLSGWVGAIAAALMPLVDLLRREVIDSSAVLHGGDTPVPILAPGTGKTRTGRLWTYVRDERPHGGGRPPAAVFFASPDRKGAHPLAHLARLPACCRPMAMPASTACMRASA